MAASGSKLKLEQDSRIAYGSAQSGASVFRDENGLRSFVAALSGSTPSGGAVMGSYMDAETVSI